MAPRLVPRPAAAARWPPRRAALLKRLVGARRGRGRPWLGGGRGAVCETCRLAVALLPPREAAAVPAVAVGCLRWCPQVAPAFWTWVVAARFPRNEFTAAIHHHHRQSNYSPVWEGEAHL